MPAGAKNDINIQVSEDFATKFWQSFTVNPSGCWLWNGGKHVIGQYPRIRLASRQYYIHQVSWCLVNGTIPRGYVVCHSCDTPTCGNWKHLFLGTPVDNFTDMVVKGRNRYGAMKHTANDVLSLSLREISSMRNEYNQGTSITALAHQYRLNVKLVKAIVHNIILSPE